jgi:hypothetical protein
VIVTSFKDFLELSRRLVRITLQQNTQDNLYSGLTFAQNQPHFAARNEFFLRRVMCGRSRELWRWSDSSLSPVVPWQERT